MPQYFFILGQNKNLSIAEIAGLKDIGFSAKSAKLVNDVLLADFFQSIEAPELINRLGGVIKIGQIFEKNLDFNNLTAAELIKLINFNPSHKVYFGFSHYGENQNNVSKISRRINSLALEIKKIFKEKGIASRWVTSRQTQLSSVIVEKEHLLDQGAELVLIEDRNKFYLGKTLVVQKFADFSFRDYGRPNRDSASGLLPPKLARIMVNLANIDKQKVILDPFCGSGTILQEAALLGYKNLIGSDISPKAISDTKNNLEWLKRSYEFKILNLKLLNVDARIISQKIEANSIGAVVTEPYLGPAKLLNQENKIQATIKELAELYLSAFREFKKVLAPGGKVVIVFPVLKHGGQSSCLPILDKIEKVGFKAESFLPPHQDSQHKKDSSVKQWCGGEPTDWPKDLIKTTARGSIIYSRPDQRVLREIFIYKIS